MRKQSFIDTVDDIFTRAKHAGIFHLSPEDESLNGRLITVDGKALINFGSCSYLGLEKEEFVIEGIIEATKRYGSQFSSSRSYMSCPLYETLEELLQQISGYPALVTPTTTLGHFSTLPTLVGIDDVVILDHQVHASVQSAVRQLRATKIQTDMVEHSNLFQLEEKINQYRHHKDKIWYCLDGVYSMYGDFAPLADLIKLQQKYSQLYLYIDDAHGFSWTGENGKGYVLSQIKLNERIVLAASLNKAFATCGGVIFFANDELKRKVRTCGGTLIFSGPIQPPMLGGAINSAKLHLNGLVEERQKKLASLAKTCSEQFTKLSLPDVSNPHTPIFYVATSLLESGFELVKQMMNQGKYVNIGLYPAVPIANTGVRFTLNTHLYEQDVIDLCQDMANSYSNALYQKGATTEQVCSAFSLNEGFSERFNSLYHQEKNTFDRLVVKVVHSIEDVDQLAWQKHFTSESYLQVDYLRALEKSFCKRQLSEDVQDEDKWEFNYICIFDQNNELVLGTLFTKCFMKDDMFLPKHVSQKAEEIRKYKPKAYSSFVLMMGTMITEGNHLYINETHEDCDKAIFQMLNWVKTNSSGVNSLILRDFIDLSPKLEKLFLNQGFIKTQGLDNHYVEQEAIGQNLEDWQMQLKAKYRYFQRSYVLPHYQKSKTVCAKDYSDEQIEYFYQLYLNVQKKAREINTYALPKQLIKQLIQLPNTEILEIYVDDNQSLPQAMVLCRKQENEYFGIVAAIDYAFMSSAVYRQLLVAIVDQARRHGVKRVHLGFGASLEKRRVGATAQKSYLYVQQLEHFSFEAMHEMSGET